MSYGTGIIGFDTPAVAASVTGANNGLSLVAGDVQLGGSSLIMNTDITLAGQPLTFSDISTQFLFQNQVFSVRDLVNANEVRIAPDGALTSVILVELPVSSVASRGVTVAHFDPFTVLNVYNLALDDLVVPVSTNFLTGFYTTQSNPFFRLNVVPSDPVNNQGDLRLFVSQDAIAETEVLTVLGVSGFVGINKPVPASQLHVDGVVTLDEVLIGMGEILQLQAVNETAATDEVGLRVSNDLGYISIQPSLNGVAAFVSSLGNFQFRDQLDVQFSFTSALGFSTNSNGLLASDGSWFLGSVQAGVAVVDNANFVNVVIDGAAVKLAIIV